MTLYDPNIGTLKHNTQAVISDNLYDISSAINILESTSNKNKSDIKANKLISSDSITIFGNGTMECVQLVSSDGTIYITAEDVVTNTDDIATKVTGPASSTNNALARFDGTTGKAVKNGAIIETDSGELLIGTSAPFGANTVPMTIYTAFASSYASYQTSSTGTGASKGTLVGHDDTGGATIFNYEDTGFRVGTNSTIRFVIDNNGYIYINYIRSGATQAAASASANELWKTSGHATLPDNVVMIGV
jgi:hypothetical protein